MRKKRVLIKIQYNDELGSLFSSSCHAAQTIEKKKSHAGPAANPVLIVFFQWLSLHCLIICANPFDCCVKWATPKSWTWSFVLTTRLLFWRYSNFLIVRCYIVFPIFERLWLVNGVSDRSGKTDQSAVGMDFDQISAGLFISNHCSVSVVSIDMRIQTVCWQRAALGSLNCQSPGWKGKSQVLSDQWSIMHQLRQFRCSHEVSLIEA